MNRAPMSDYNYLRHDLSRQKELQFPDYFFSSSASGFNGFMRRVDMDTWNRGREASRTKAQLRMERP